MHVLTEYSIISTVVILLGLSVLLYTDESFDSIVTYLTFCIFTIMLGLTWINYWMNEDNCLDLKRWISEWLD